jgi:sec-independent protein translocase protein TatC
MRRRIKPISHEDRLTVVDHLDELRSRLFVAIGAFVVAFALCGWQNELVLEIVNKPLPDRLDEPLTFGVTEPFVTTFTNAAYAALLISLPVILYEIYAFVLPAFSPLERRVATPLLLLVPFLFIGGVVFCYFVVLPPAIDFLLDFNADEFNTQIRARDYYSFVTLTMVAMGLGFQVPVGILAAVRLGITTPDDPPVPPLRAVDRARGRVRAPARRGRGSRRLGRGQLAFGGPCSSTSAEDAAEPSRRPT